MNYIVVGPYDGVFFVAYQIVGTTVYQPVGDTMSRELAIEECAKLNAEAKATARRREKGLKRRFDDWVGYCRQNGIKLVPEHDPVFAFADEIKLPDDYVRLAWIEFSRKHREPRAKSYIDWNAHFRNAVRENWYKLWYPSDAGGWGLTVRGKQVEAELKAKQQHEQRQQ